MAGGERLDHPRGRRLLAKVDFDRVYRTRRRISRGLVTVHYAGNEQGDARLGISAGRRVGNAVRRNWVKRRVREAFRASQALRGLGVDIVFHAGALPNQASRAELARDFEWVVSELARRCRV